LPDVTTPVTPAPEMEVTQNSVMPESIPLIISDPLITESGEQDQPAHKAPLLIQPVEPTEVALEEPKQDSVTSVIEAEKKDENL